MGNSSLVTNPNSYSVGTNGEGLLISDQEIVSYGSERVVDFVALGLQNGAAGGSGFRFMTNPANSNSAVERVRITASGNVGIGTTSPGATLDVQGSSQWPLRLRNTASSAGHYWSIGPDANNHLVIYNQGGVGMYMATGATSWSANSDLRVKKNFLPISDALEKTLQLRGLTYHYKTDADTDPRRVGVIAQEVQLVLPEAVSEHEGILAVKYTEIIPLLIEAIKELKNHVDHKFESLLPLWAEKNAEIAQLKARADKADAESAQLKAALCSKFQDIPMCASN